MVVSGLTEDYYERLGISRNATSQQIKKAYRKKAPESHPDHGGSNEEFIALKEAYEALLDPETRKKYDRGEGTRGSAGGAAPPPKDSGAPVTVYPYVTPDQITWTADDAHPLEPITVRLSNRSGLAITKFGPESMSGTCWTIDGWDIVMDGEDLADYVIAPIGDVALAVGKLDNVNFFVDDNIVTLPITVTASAGTKSTDSPGRRRSPPASGSWGPGKEAVPEPHVPTRTARSRRGILALVLAVIAVGIIVALTSKSTPAPHGISRAPTISPKHHAKRPQRSSAGQGVGPTSGNTAAAPTNSGPNNAGSATHKASLPATTREHSGPTVPSKTRSTSPPLEGHSGGGSTQTGGGATLEGQTNEHPAPESKGGGLEGTSGGSGGGSGGEGGLSGKSVE